VINVTKYELFGLVEIAQADKDVVESSSQNYPVCPCFCASINIYSCTPPR